MRTLVWLLRALAASVHALVGGLAYRLGRRHAARRHYERVLLLRGADFHAYLQLGRIAFDLGDYATWRRELEHARRLDPNRFARQHHPLDLIEPRLAGTNVDVGTFDPAGYDSTRATWRLPRPNGGPGAGTGGGSGSGPRPAAASEGRFEWDAAAELSPPEDAVPPIESPGPKSQPPAGERRRGAAPVPPLDDCSSLAERERFQHLGPIDAEELGRCNLDELLRKLSG